MKRLIVFKGKKYHYGLFYGAYSERCLYEQPLINQLAMFFRDKIYQNLFLVKSKDIRQVEQGVGIIIGELDALTLCIRDKIIIPIEIKNKNMRDLTKKMNLTKIILKFVLKWIYKNNKKLSFLEYIPIWYFRENICQETKDILKNCHVLPLEFHKIRKYVLEKAKNSPSFLKDNHDLIKSNIRSEIPKNSSIHPLIMQKLKPDFLHPIDQIIPFQNLIQK
ncbi:MAG: hypothetical protein ACTSRZ_13530 [Promethearchaeota archaeon]